MKLPLLRPLAVCLMAAAQSPADSLPASPFSALPQTAPAEDGEKNIVRPREESILAQSTILSDGTCWTLVPKGAVLHLPATHKARVDSKPLGSLLPWADFLARNFAWLGTCELSLDQAAGKQPLAAGLSDNWTKLGKVVVAVHLAGPVSVKPAAPASEATPTASTR